MENILNYINNLGQFQLNLLSATVFAILLYITQKIIKKSKNSSIEFLNIYKESYLHKYIAHHKIYESEEVALPVRFFFHVSLMSIMWLFIGLLILIFFYGVQALSTGNWFIFLGHWFAFNSFLEGYMWSRDSRKDETAKELFEKKYGQENTENKG